MTRGKKEKYGGDKKVDEWLLNQVVKHVNHDEIGSFARDLEVPESVYSSITKDKDKAFKVMSLLLTPILLKIRTKHLI